jgi:hypothetical protein
MFRFLPCVGDIRVVLSTAHQLEHSETRNRHSIERISLQNTDQVISSQEIQIQPAIQQVATAPQQQHSQIVQNERGTSSKPTRGSVRCSSWTASSSHNDNSTLRMPSHAPLISCAPPPTQAADCRRACPSSPRSRARLWRGLCFRTRWSFPGWLREEELAKD